VLKVDENDIVATTCHVVIERDWAPNAGMRMGETLGAARPRPLESWHPEDGAIRRGGVVDRFECWKAGKIECHLHGAANVGGAEVEDIAILDQLRV
jgi:hypothetical protein